MMLLARKHLADLTAMGKRTSIRIFLFMGTATCMSIGEILAKPRRKSFLIWEESMESTQWPYGTKTAYCRWSIPFFRQRTANSFNELLNFPLICPDSLRGPIAIEGFHFILPSRPVS
jgi:hypothetical protein